jgi:hypothetical protein
VKRRRIGDAPPDPVLADRLEWLRQVRAGEDGDPTLLVSGLGEADAERWEIGVVDAWVEVDGEDGSPSIWLRFVKPNKRAPEERPISEVRMDPEAAFAFQAHVLYAGRLCMTWSTSHGPGRPPYHYPRVLLPTPGRPFRFLRMIASTPSGRLAQVGRDNWRDLRRRNLIAPITRAQASARYGAQNGRRYLDREDAVARSLPFYRAGLIVGFDKPEDYAEALRDTYALLDARRPLGEL